MTSSAAFATDLSTIAGLELTADQRALLVQAQDAYGRFVQLDGQIIAAHRAGSAQGAARAGDLVGGAELEQFAVIASSVGALADFATQQASAAPLAAAESARHGRAVVWVTGGAGVLVAAALALVLTVSIRRPLRDLESGPMRRDDVTSHLSDDGAATDGASRDGEGPFSRPTRRRAARRECGQRPAHRPRGAP